VTQYVFSPRDVIRYRFPTHTNDLIMDRRAGTAAEAFFVILEPGEAPPGVPHSVRCVGDSRFVYLSIDCFTAGPPSDEPTWDSHVRAMCETNGWEYDAVNLGRVEGENHALRGR
jgi:hypothetical protein